MYMKHCEKLCEMLCPMQDYREIRGKVIVKMSGNVGWKKYIR